MTKGQKRISPMKVLAEMKWRHRLLQSLYTSCHAVSPPNTAFARLLHNEVYLYKCSIFGIDA